MCYSDIIQEIYALVDQSYKDYQRKLKELYGKEVHEKIMDALNVKKRKNGIYTVHICLVNATPISTNQYRRHYFMSHIQTDSSNPQ